MTYGVYVFTNNINNLKYVGRSVNVENRIRIHKSDANLKKRVGLLGKALEEYGWQNFSVEIVATVEPENVKHLEELERYYIDELNTLHPNGYNLNNRTVTSLGLRKSEETKQKISKSMSGNKNPMFGKHHSLEHRQRMSDARIGNTYNTKTLVKIDYKTLEVLATYRGLTNAERVEGIKSATIWNRLNQRLVVDGVFWMYETDDIEQYVNTVRYAKNKKV